MRLRCLRSISLSIAALALGGLLGASACSSSGGGGAGGTGSSGSGGPVTGPADAHCGAKAQVTSAAACKAGSSTSASTSTSTSTGTSTGTSTSTGAGGAGTGGAGGAGGADMSDYGPTLDNAEGDDDDCKYHVKFTSTSVGENADVTFTVVATTKTDGKPLTGAETLIEAFLSDIHPAPNTKAVTTEGPPGTYTIGPIRFDAAGKWTVRFHFYEQCVDLTEDSPHGHAAFYLQVP